MYKGKIDKLINEINKIARLKRISYKLENIYEVNILKIIILWNGLEYRKME